MGTDERISDNVDAPGQSPSTEAVGPAGRNYEDLVGGEGRGIFFRPRRYSNTELLDVHPMVTISLLGERYSCALHDVSQNGVAVVWPDDVTVEPGQFVSEVGILFDGFEAYRGGGFVQSIRADQDRKIVGVSFHDSLMNIADVIHLRDLRQFSAQKTVELGIEKRAWYVEGYSQFKAGVADFRMFLEDSRAELEKLEGTLPWDVVYGGTQSTTRQALIESLRQDFVPTFVRLSEGIDSASRNIPKDALLPLKQFAQRQVQAQLLTAPITYRTLYKPLGYPGDYHVMRYMYEDHFEGSTLFGRAVHLAMNSTMAPEAVRQRKRILKQQVRERLSQWTSSRSIKICSIAAGPAQELFEVLRQGMDVPFPVEIILFDQDPDALAFAQGRISQVIAQNRYRNVKVTYLHDSIKRLLSDPALLTELGPFDIILCAGLFDYLPFSTASRLTRTFFQQLAPEGSCFIGNMHPSNPCRYLMEHHLEWYLIYRTADEMLEFGALGAPEARLHLVTEPTGVNPFLVVKKEQ